MLTTIITTIAPSIISIIYSGYHRTQNHNLSSTQLTEDEMKVLSKCLKFTPTPKANVSELKTDIMEFNRKLRLTEYFHADNNNDVENTMIPTHEIDLVRNKSNFDPKPAKTKTLKYVCNTLSSLPIDDTNNTNKNNLTTKERRALNKLMNNTDIVIKEADKGGAVVIMNKEFYNSKIKDMLENDQYYIKINNNEDKKNMTKIKRTINKHNQTTQFTSKEKDYLTNFYFKESNFYGLPKIHKCNTIKNAIETQRNQEYITCIEPNDLTFRPIVGGPQSPTQRLSNLIDILLKPFCNHINSYLRDSLDFLTQLPNTTTNDSILTTFDITNMYSNIDTTLGIEAISYWIDQHPNSLHQRFSKQFLIDAIKIVLENNTFTFNNHHGNQIKGTAMGSKMSPNYSTLTLGFLEKKLYQEINNRWGISVSNQITNKWKRYLDDCFIIWDYGQEQLDTFSTILNNLNPNLKFTMETSANNIPFLDVMIIKTDTNIKKNT